MFTQLVTEPGYRAPKPTRKRASRIARSYNVCGMFYSPEGSSNIEFLPYMKLRGRWLHELGFEIGARLKVEATQDTIILTVVERPVRVPEKIPRKILRAAREEARAAARAAAQANATPAP